MICSLLDKNYITSNRESGDGRYDIQAEPLPGRRVSTAKPVEFKIISGKDGDHSVEDTARRALKQIEDLHCGENLKSRGFGEDRIRKYGIGFRGKDVCIVCPES